MNKFKPLFCVAVAALMAAPPSGFAASHREAPITALDTKADITDIYAFVSYDDPSKVTLILNVDPLLAPGNGPNYFPFDDNILYEIKIDNNDDAVEEVTFQVRFQTEIRAPDVFTGFVGAGSGIKGIVPPAITALDGPGSEGFSLRQTYTVTMVNNGTSTALTNSTGNLLFAVPTNVGPRTMPDYTDLAKQGIYTLNNGVKVFAGTVDDPFYIDLGAAFDSLNFRKGPDRSIGGVLTPAQDADDHTNTAPDFVSGFNVNTIAFQVPITMLTSTGTKLAASNPAATIGVWGTTSRPRITVRRAPDPASYSGSWSQVQRMGNPLINELIIGTGDKDFWSMSEPANDSQFAHYALNPLLATVVQAVYGINIPAAPRNDLLLLMEYLPPIAAPGTPHGPVADLLRLNTGVAPTPQPSRRRLGVLAGDLAGFPNGRRVSDDVTDIALRVVAGGVLVSGFNVHPNNLLGDGVNTNDLPYQETFPYVAFAHSGKDSRHIDPGEPGCTMNTGAPCPIN
ncbi:MAG: DUF4331 domain-containing protein [Bryobacteraceae bacterium]